MCSNRRDVLTEIHATDFGDMEREWLHIVRLHCMSYEHNQAEGWDRAITHAEMRFGADEGPAIASRIAVLVRSMREERLGGFGYLSPFCPSCRLRVTEDEHQLITLMQVGLRGEGAAIQEAAAEFAGRPEAPILAAAAARFGSAIAAAVAPHRASRAASGVRLH